MRHPLSAIAATALLSACATSTAPPEPNMDIGSVAPSVATPCPAEVPADARCFKGQDGVGSHYLVAIPKDWRPATGVLVMHAHGGPADTGPAKAERAEEDLKRWAITVRAGHAWAGSTYRRGGYGVTMAAEDTERLRRIFVRDFGPPRRTLLHGQSYGAGVAAKAAELYSPPGRRAPYDGVLLTSGVLGGGGVAYDFRLDLRVVYQFYCNNHPRPDEPSYPLWSGLAKDSTLTRAQLASRIDECTGVRKPAAQRSEPQKARLDAIVKVVNIPEQSLISHLTQGTWLFHDLVQLRLGGRNPFDNSRVRYRGSPDDAALNAGVLRYTADPKAVALLAQDSAPTGRVGMPVLTFHAANDPTAFVELESVYREVFERAGTEERLVQVFSDEAGHSYLGEAQYPALFSALLEWIDHGARPTPHRVLALCRDHEASYGKSCRIQPDWRSPPLHTRVAPRQP